MVLMEQFEVMRPYRDHEVKPAVERLLDHPRFKPVASFLFSEYSYDNISEKLRAADSVETFQKAFSAHVVKRILDLTATGFSFSGVENISPGTPYLFVGNHRDIVLDAAIMQYLLNEAGHRTSQITFGINLMYGQFLLDLGKLNKMFTFYRGGSRAEQYNNALINSAYINHVIREEKESIWIAQRNGRTKNGDDKTQNGLLKMFSMNSKNMVDTLEALNIVPVTISYEIEPCDIQKVRELYMSRRAKYVKEEEEDFRSILSGITGDKGRVHYCFGNPLNDYIRELGSKGLRGNEFIEKIAREIDRQVYRDYQLWPSNFIAYDLLGGADEMSGNYNEKDKSAFMETMQGKLATLEGMDQEELRILYLEMYANPVINAKRYGEIDH